MSGRKNRQPRKTNKRVLARFFGGAMMSIILIILLFVLFNFLRTPAVNIVAPQTDLQFSSNENNAPTTPLQIENNVINNNELVEENKDDDNAKYYFYDELKKRRSEVDAEVERKIAENRNQPVLEGNTYRIQVGAFQSKERADRLRARIILRDYPVDILRSSSIYLVQVGPYADKETAQAVQRKLEREGMNTLLKNYVSRY